jgi:hypothetical protein
VEDPHLRGRDDRRHDGARLSLDLDDAVDRPSVRVPLEVELLRGFVEDVDRCKVRIENKGDLGDGGLEDLVRIQGVDLLGEPRQELELLVDDRELLAYALNEIRPLAEALVFGYEIKLHLLEERDPLRGFLKATLEPVFLRDDIAPVHHGLPGTLSTARRRCKKHSRDES